MFFGSNVQESGGGARGFPKTGDSSDTQAALRWDLEKRGSVEVNQGSRYTDNGYEQ